MKIFGVIFGGILGVMDESDEDEVSEGKNK